MRRERDAVNATFPLLMVSDLKYKCQSSFDETKLMCLSDMAFDVLQMEKTVMFIWPDTKKNHFLYTKNLWNIMRSSPTV